MFRTENKLIAGLRGLEKALVIDYENPAGSGLTIPDYASKQEVQAMTAEQLKEFTKQSAELSLRTVKILSNLLIKSSPKSYATNITLRDLIADKNLLHPFISLRLWEKITQYNLRSINSTDKCFKKLQPKEEKPDTKKAPKKNAGSYLAALQYSFSDELVPLINTADENYYLTGFVECLKQKKNIPSIFKSVDATFIAEWLSSYESSEKNIKKSKNPKIAMVEKSTPDLPQTPDEDELLQNDEEDPLVDEKAFNEEEEPLVDEDELLQNEEEEPLEEQPLEEEQAHKSEDEQHYFDEDELDEEPESFEEEQYNEDPDNEIAQDQDNTEMIEEETNTQK